MATFYWLGTALTASNKNSLDPYDWNYPSNWLVSYSSYSNFVIANEAPGSGDIVYIGKLPDGNLPAGVSGTTMARSPLLFGGCSGMSPIGVPAGATGLNAVWLNSIRNTSSGGTFSSDLSSLWAYLDQHQTYVDPTTPNTRIYHAFPFYCFPYLGGGVGTLTPQAAEVSAYLQETRGCTAVYGNTLTQRQRDGLNLRVNKELHVQTTGRINRNYPVGDYRNYQAVDINLVPSKSSTVSSTKSSTNPTAVNKLRVTLGGNFVTHDNLVEPSSIYPRVIGEVGANKRGSGDITIRRFTSYYDNNGVPTVQYRGGVPLIYKAEIDNQSKQLVRDSGQADLPEDIWALGLSSASSRSLRANISDAIIFECTAINVPAVTIDDGCTMGSFRSVNNFPLSESARVYDDYVNDDYIKVTDEEAMLISSNFDGVQVQSALGFPGATAYPGMNNIVVESAFGIPGNSKTYYKPRLVLGEMASFSGNELKSNTVKVDSISFVEPGILPVASETSPVTYFENIKWQMEFIGPVSITSIDAQNCWIAANDDFRKSESGLSGININTLNLGVGSILDLNSVPSFDDWFFGSYITGSTNNGFIGGIALLDTDAEIFGSRGVRLYNTKNVGTNYDTRSGTYVP